jgi:hypothetical protein
LALAWASGKAPALGDTALAWASGKAQVPGGMAQALALGMAPALDDTAQAPYPSLLYVSQLFVDGLSFFSFETLTHWVLYRHGSSPPYRALRNIFCNHPLTLHRRRGQSQASQPQWPRG